MNLIWQHLRYAVRTLMKKAQSHPDRGPEPALGIGANTAIFSLIYTSCCAHFRILSLRSQTRTTHT